MFEVLEGGLQTTVQDLGRGGYLARGVPPSGAQDPWSLRMANLLVGNPIGDRLLVGRDPGEAGLEILLFGFKMKILRETAVAVTGADLSPTMNGQPLPMWRAVRVGPGDILAFGMSRSGARAYLAIAGGIDVPHYLHSKSTYVRGSVGGFQGRPLKKGDILQTGEPRVPLDQLEGRALGPHLVPAYGKEWELRVVLGPQDHLFADESVATFLTADWVLSPTSDRMGFRFIGPKLEFKPRPDYLVREAGSDPSNIVDDTIQVGGIQVPSGLEPIVMGVDGPSLGGYAKIATVISLDMSRVGQARSGEIIHFRPVTADGATTLMRQAEVTLVEESVRRVKG